MDSILVNIVLTKIALVWMANWGTKAKGCCNLCLIIIHIHNPTAEMGKAWIHAFPGFFHICSQEMGTTETTLSSLKQGLIGGFKLRFIPGLLFLVIWCSWRWAIH